MSSIRFPLSHVGAGFDATVSSIQVWWMPWFLVDFHWAGSKNKVFLYTFLKLTVRPPKKKENHFYTKGKICDPSNEYSGAMLVSWRVYKMVTNKKTSWWKTSHETFQRDQNITSSPDNKKIHWLSKEISKISSILMHFVRLIFLPV